MKECKRCGKTMELTSFYTHMTYEDGKSSICIECKKEGTSMGRLCKAICMIEKYILNKFHNGKIKGDIVYCVSEKQEMTEYDIVKMRLNKMYVDKNMTLKEYDEYLIGRKQWIN